MTDFVNLHNHTSFSILDSLISVRDLFITAKELGQKAIAITDHGSLAGAWDGLKVSKETDVKLIIGMEAYFINSVSEKQERFRHIILLAKNATGYRNLLSLNKEGFDNSAVFAKKVYPLIDWQLLEKYHEGLICLTSCSNGIIAQLLMNKKMEEAEAQLLKLRNIFGDDLGLEVQANTLKRNASAYNDTIEQVFVNAHIIRLGRKHKIKVVATSNAHYCKKEDHETHDVMLAIGSHQPIYSNFRLRYDCPDFYIKSGDEIKTFFERNYGSEFAEELCANSIYFADRCEFPAWIDPKFSNPSGKELPEFPCKDELDYPEFLIWMEQQEAAFHLLDEDKRFLRFRCEKLFKIRIGNNIEPNKLIEYNNRIAEELDVFEFHGFSSYMLIVADYIAWARTNKIAVGPGRGSVGGSLVAFLLGIHQADPVKYDLVFARFHNKEKSSFPDIDTDFSDRDRVEQYCRRKYGDDHVARVSNINTVTPKVYARDMARACEFGGSKERAVQVGTEIADTLSVEIKTVESALEKVPLFSEYAKKYPELIKHAAINGKFRAWATHAAGIVISKRPLTGLVPLRRDKDGVMCLEYDKDRAEENGLIKMDLLGLSTLNVIENIHKLIEENGKESPLPNYDIYDEATYNLISSGNTFGVFQLGTSSGTIDLCRKIKPKSLNDISYINSLARPSARDMRNDFILTKDGKRPFSLLHPTLDRAFNNTFGFGLYEESLFFLAQDVAGWNMHAADRLRKMTKDKGKNPKKVEALRMEFIEGAVKNNVNEAIAKRIWDEVIDKFQGYGFNKSLSFDQKIDVYTKEGRFITSKLIGEILSGDYVRSRDEKSGNDIFVEVIDKHNHGILPLVEIELKTGETIKCTMEHKFRVEESGEMLPLWKIIKDDLTIIVNTADTSVEVKEL
jgi:DNA polymerase III subunit alpha